MLNKNKSKVESAENQTAVKNTAVLGHYEGECADSNITNLNGLDITREVWETVFASDEYKKALANRWYIGYLGHPEDDPDCQDFRKACIVMTEGHIEDNGKVYGKFDLIDTPVGRIVKAFQDAGVIFGISVRGAGDIIQNSVDPDTFIFRGFDLVTFPAFPESIPKFIAASSDPSQRQKYQAVSAAVKTNLDSLDTVASIETVQACFAKQSDEYKMLEEKKQSIESSETSDVSVVEKIPEDKVEILTEDEDSIDPRVDSMTRLYLDEKSKNLDLIKENRSLRKTIDTIMADNARRMASVERICSSQINDLNRTLETVEASLKKETSKRTRIQGSVDMKDRKIKQLTSRVRDLEGQLSKVQASLDASSEAAGSLRKDCRDLSKQLSSVQEENLKYIAKVEAADSQLESKDAIISAMKVELAETVSKHDKELRESNRDDEVKALKSRIEAAESLISDYQDAYINMYANALGVHLPKMSITASTSVASLTRMIRSSASIPMKPDFLEPTQGVDSSDFEVTEFEDEDLVTL